MLVPVVYRFGVLKKASVLATAQGEEGNITQNRTNNKGRYHNKSYVDGLNNIESWKLKKSKYNITTHGQYWYWCHKHKMEGKFDENYMNHPANQNDKW